jgi:plastocyanin
MKKLVVGIALVLASLALAACGGGSDTTSTEPTSEGGGGGQGNQAKESEKPEGGATGGAAAEGGTAGGGSVVKFETPGNGELAYTTKSATAKAGSDTIELNNPQPLAHDVAIEDSGGETIAKTDLVTEGSTSTKATLKPGSYTFYCSVPGHREAGMEGKLTVK